MPRQNVINKHTEPKAGTIPTSASVSFEQTVSQIVNWIREELTLTTKEVKEAKNAIIRIESGFGNSSS